MSLNLSNKALMLALLESDDVAAFNKHRKEHPDQPMDFCGANLRLADLTDANLTGANLRLADFTGADLTDADLTDADLTDADLTDADLTDADLRLADLTNADLTNADLWEADLWEADLTNADLQGVKFSLAKLRGAKLPYDAPTVPKIHQQLADVVNKDNLDMGDWHSSCGTTHCRAGWVVTLAGEKGKELEEKIGTNAAAALIYMASDPELEKIPDWAASNEAALADIQAMAAK